MTNDKENNTSTPKPLQKQGSQDASRQRHFDEKSIPPSVENGGQKGLEPTRYGDWEKGGRCTDF